MKVKEIVERFALENNIIAGVCDADRLDFAEAAVRNIDTPFVSKNTDLRLTPALTMESAKSIIVVGLSYNKKPAYAPDKKQRGNISAGAVGTDYHIIIKEILEKLAKTLLEHYSFSYKIFVDNGPLLERELAKKAGLGFAGRNCSIISEKLGSFFFIGHMLTDLYIQPSKGYPFDFNKCGSCQKCVDACPTGALSPDSFRCDYTKCISYLTQKKDALSEYEEKALGIQIYGCDVCQRVCPYNENVYIEEVLDIEQMSPCLIDLCNMSKIGFLRRFKHTAAGWRGMKVLKRNASIALSNITAKTKDI